MCSFASVRPLNGILLGVAIVLFLAITARPSTRRPAGSKTGSKRSPKLPGLEVLEGELQQQRRVVRLSAMGFVLGAWSLASKPPLSNILFGLAAVLLVVMRPPLMAGLNDAGAKRAQKWLGREVMECELQRERRAVRLAIFGAACCAWSLGAAPPLNGVLLALAGALFVATML